jgi:predicted unusual protein kinase regulating ubiquinone biosynthesis (AarF/ABC1/UbiB family)
MPIWKWIRVTIWFIWNGFTITKKEKEFAEQLTSLGTIGIKLGQYLCNRPKFCSNSLKKQLLSFLSHNPIHDESYTKQVLQSYKMDIQLLKIIGSGSIAQVYECIYKGKTYALKINHPFDEFKSDIYLFRWIVWLLRFFIPIVNHIDWEEWFNSLEKQLDMRNEAIIMKHYRKIYKLFPLIRIPQCIRKERDFILMSFEHGIPIYKLMRNDIRYIKAHLLVMSSFLHTGFVYNIMHGDIHEGNILVRKNGIVLLDFGICFKLNMSKLTKLLSNPNPSRKDMLQLLSVLLVDDNKDKKELAITLIKEYNRLFLGSHVPSFTDLFETILVLVKKHQFVIRSSILTYMINLMLLEDISPFKSSFDQFSTLLAIYMMKLIPFFKRECGLKMDGYFKMLLHKSLLHN